MKKCIILLLGIACIICCNQEHDSQNSQEPFTSGKWYIMNYQKNGEERQNLYTGLNFIFSNDNLVTAKRGNHNYSGEWLLFKSDITDDAPQTDIDFNITFKDQSELDSLNGEWIILEKTNRQLKLIREDIQGKSLLLFQKK